MQLSNTMSDIYQLKKLEKEFDSNNHCIMTFEAKGKNHMNWYQHLYGMDPNSCTNVKTKFNLYDKSILINWINYCYRSWRSKQACFDVDTDDDSDNKNGDDDDDDSDNNNDDDDYSDDNNDDDDCDYIPEQDASYYEQIEDVEDERQFNIKDYMEYKDVNLAKQLYFAERNQAIITETSDDIIIDDKLLLYLQNKIYDNKYTKTNIEIMIKKLFQTTTNLNKKNNKKFLSFFFLFFFFFFCMILYQHQIDTKLTQNNHC